MFYCIALHRILGFGLGVVLEAFCLCGDERLRSRVRYPRVVFAVLGCELDLAVA